MFSSTDDPFESLLRRSFTYDQNPSSRQDDTHQCFTNFPSPFLDNHESPLNQIFSQNQPMRGTNITNYKEGNSEPCKFNENSADQVHHEAITPVRKRNPGPTTRKRTGKKDRHSKICTAQGIRDRRMRLSVQVARKFFDLQDMLGYDKASNTIDWLFAKSKKAIKDLTKNLSDQDQAKISSSIDNVKCESFVSECEVASGIVENSNNEFKGVSAKRVSPPGNSHEKDDRNYIQKVVRKPKSNMKESRDKARARAREKTMIRRLKNLSQWQKSNCNEFQESGFSTSPFEPVEESSSGDRKRDTPYDVDCHLFGNQSADDDTIEKFLGGTISSKSCPISEYDQCYDAAISGCIDSNNNFMGFLGDCEVNNDMLNSSISEMENMVSFAGNPISYVTSDFLFHQ